MRATPLHTYILPIILFNHSIDSKMFVISVHSCGDSQNYFNFSYITGKYYSIQIDLRGGLRYLCKYSFLFYYTQSFSYLT